MRKNILPVLLLVSVMLVSIFAIKLWTTHAEEQVVFTDVPTDVWFYSYVTQAVNAKIASGYADAAGHLTGEFGPSDSVTIAQATKMAVLSAKLDVPSYADKGTGVPGHWVDSYWRAAEAEGFAMLGADPDRPATRAEVAAMVAGAFKVKLPTSSESAFSDVTPITPGASSILALNRDGVVAGDTDSDGKPTGFFRPVAGINRAEAVKIFLSALVTYSTHAAAPSESSAVSSSSKHSSSAARSSVSSAYTRNRPDPRSGCGVIIGNSDSSISVGNPPAEKAPCGDGIKISGEQCDDKNKQSGDGCSDSCQIESGWTCGTSLPTYCWSTCGDGVIVNGEKCDDGNAIDDDGCTQCQIDSDYKCSGAPSSCTPLFDDSSSS